ncbi:MULTISPECIES: hypothetical protein [unclassified Acidocella]|uniref:hypothetical protein n=1 Tax=unclassified Acidocella TaxID=2648610 RepID=UPI00028C0DF8|nr:MULTISPECIES: hypothetical protein [unclassified Acidocella]EKN01106.1 hypothetical protein MXAZACID_02334 [Acidocella sp. MX-AZ02]WBO60563.1 hypothetical protein GT370_07270 [Acidocella sp. MX-AZ03]
MKFLAFLAIALLPFGAAAQTASELYGTTSATANTWTAVLPASSSRVGGYIQDAGTGSIDIGVGPTTPTNPVATIQPGGSYPFFSSKQIWLRSPVASVTYQGQYAQ